MLPAFTFLSVTAKYPLALACDDVPNANGAIVAAGHEHATSSCQSTYGMIMTFQVKLVVRIFFHILLQMKGVNVSGNSNQSRDWTHIGRIGI